jgi:hypothetical protein
MCTEAKNFTLCTCSTGEKVEIVHNKNSRRYKKFLSENNPAGIAWTLYQYKGMHYSGMDGWMIMPADQLSEMFTAEYVKNELNKRNCFDFDYAPKEGDYLVLKLHLTKQEAKKQEYRYMPFIYQDEQWTINYYNAFYQEITEFKNGKVKIE